MVALRSRRRTTSAAGRSRTRSRRSARGSVSSSSFTTGSTFRWRRSRASSDCRSGRSPHDLLARRRSCAASWRKSVSSELERLLREARQAMPLPDEPSTERVRQRVARKLGRRRRRTRALVLVGATIVAVVALGVTAGSLNAPTGTAAREPAVLGFVPEPRLVRPAVAAAGGARPADGRRGGQHPVRGRRRRFTVWSSRRGCRTRPSEPAAARRRRSSRRWFPTRRRTPPGAVDPLYPKRSCRSIFARALVPPVGRASAAGSATRAVPASGEDRELRRRSRRRTSGRPARRRRSSTTHSASSTVSSSGRPRHCSRPPGVSRTETQRQLAVIDRTYSCATHAPRGHLPAQESRPCRHPPRVRVGEAPLRRRRKRRVGGAGHRSARTRRATRSHGSPPGRRPRARRSAATPRSSRCSVAARSA